MAKDPYRYFRIEAGELLGQLARSVLDLEKGSFSAELVMRLLRLAHTLKGAARVVRQIGIADLSHRLEDTLTPYRDGALALPREQVDSVLAIIDAIAAQVAQLPSADIPDAVAPGTAPRPPQSTPTPPIKQLQPPLQTVRADLLELDILIEGLTEIGNEVTAVRRAIDTIERIRTLAKQCSLQQPTPSATLAAASEEMRTLLMKMERDMSAGIVRVEQELRQVRDVAERMRLVPVSSIFNALERTARDAAHSTGKQVIFDASGADVRIDGSILDSVQSALIQLVRNAVAHGVEMTPQRRLAAKPDSGRISIEVERRGYRVCFRCRDDGAGVDLDAVRRALTQKGVPSADIQKMDAAALMTLLLKGGISTTKVVTEISGRGIGLDLVRETMQMLNGEVIALTQSGHGTSIELSVPLSLAAIEVLIIDHAGYEVAVPLNAVRCTLRIAAQDIISTPNGKCIVFESRQIPLAALNLGPAQPRVAASSGTLTAVVVTVADAIVALTVEHLCGIDSVVLRALPASCPLDPMVLGVHLDGAGNPRMVLDPEVLVLQRSGDTTDVINSSATAIDGSVQQQPALPILIIDDSLTTRMLECSILESAGFRVEMATCAEEGWEMARRNRYGLFLVDVEMPGMDGFSFVELTQTDPSLRDVPSILVSSRDALEDKARGLASGARHYIVKGEFDQVEFLSRVNELVLRYELVLR